MSSKPVRSLAALAAASTALHAAAEPAPVEEVVGYRYTSYQEGDIPQERTYTPVTQRYDIDVHQVRYGRPLGGGWYINGEAQYETLSGASPMQTYRNSEDQSVVLMSGASIDESRFDIKVSPTRYFSERVDATLGGTLAMSTENDYDSVSAGVDGSLDLFNRSTTLFGSLSMSYDQLSPTDAFLSDAREAADGRVKRSISLYQGVSQVLNRKSVLLVGAGFTRMSGYLSDPYKFEDRRPGERTQFNVSGQYRRFMDVGDGAALHADARLYSDSWGVYSQTLTLRWAQEILQGDLRWQVTPMVRYYRQTQASFYSLQLEPPADEYNSSDYRLSTYGALTLGATAQLHLQKWTLSADWQQYMSREDLVLLPSPDSETPALVDFMVLSFGVEYRIN